MIRIEFKHTFASMRWNLCYEFALIVWCRNLTSIILRITYGYKTIEGDDPLVNLAHLANSQLSLGTSPGTYYVDLFPFSGLLILLLMHPTLIILVKYIPSCLPGAGFKRKSKQYAAVIRDLVETPHAWAKNQLVRNIVCFDLCIKFIPDFRCCFTIICYPPAT